MPCLANIYSKDESFVSECGKKRFGGHWSFVFFSVFRKTANGHLTMKMRTQADAIVSARQTHRQPNKVIHFA